MEDLQKSPYDTLFVFVAEEGGEGSLLSYKDKQIVYSEFMRLFRGEFFTDLEFQEFLKSNRNQ